MTCLKKKYKIYLTKKSHKKANVILKLMLNISKSKCWLNLLLQKKYKYMYLMPLKQLDKIGSKSELEKIQKQSSEILLEQEETCLD